MTAEKVDFEKRDGVGWLTIRRPETRNALTKAMYAAIRDCCRQAWLDDEIYAVVVSGSDGAFAVGGDLKEMLASLEAADRTKVMNYEEYLPFETLRSLPKPTIAVVDGLCLGGGLTLMLMCDLAVATTRSSFAAPEAMVGIVDGHMPRLLRDRVPSAILRYWLYTGARFSPADAMQGGLLTQIVEPDALESTVARILGELRASSASAIALYKHTLNETRQLSSMQDAYTTMLGDDARARLQAFSERSAAKSKSA